ncbi:Flp family type IVb pilin [Aurantiacibacter rhizosphaerae]|uniref:Flp family type IVb pilin n=1 Tax=Aurantiacibacter rhizosphaerae TaxID=2691582 RepID=A0A844XDZ3_9SPHN|nr:Flp family type IVb pilin [Aurantiacibacter rhizosphaerae]MWV27814.1 Flp family type IVb pilin [Aurantiacibacter rhizosphaerae]
MHDTQGATAIEYGLIAGLIVIGMIVALQDFANESTEMWSGVETKFDNANNI